MRIPVLLRNTAEAASGSRGGGGRWTTFKRIGNSCWFLHWFPRYGWLRLDLSLWNWRPY